jgi:4-alpha-glucanotransferase
MGPQALKFADFLVEAGQSCWQILPLTPTSTFIGNSPYSSDSAFAGNPLLISPELLVRDGWLSGQDIEGFPAFHPQGTDYEAATAFRERLFDLAFERHAQDLPGNFAFKTFRDRNSAWLPDYGLFKAVKESLGGMAWMDWPEPLRRREPEALAQRREMLAARVLKEEFVQFLFFDQWTRLKAGLAERDLLVVGDMPIYVTQDSADVWANQGLFKLKKDGHPEFVAGVPPDYFSVTGQRWGNPVYDWQAHADTGFEWWVKRMGHNLALYDFVRLDHFRGFAGYWEIPAQEKTAVKGQWVDGPGEALFKALLAHFPVLPILAEDLGVITPDVRELRDGFALPGMKILQFAFGPQVGENRDAPHNHVPDSVVYTGTHDNTTTLDWIRNELGPEGKKCFFEYLGRELPEHEVPWAMIRLAYMSVSRLAVVPMQDILGLGIEGRMNMPSKARGNWAWRCPDSGNLPELAAKLKNLADMYGRARQGGTRPNPA